ncbi:MAG: TrmH family RNA methyltransferase [Spirochaetales bacterium]|nr:TrmH family RNA methyltransferase [Candidatus Physcosoma equi]
MITIKKIETLKPRVRIRKLGGIFHEAVYTEFDAAYLESAYQCLLGQELLTKETREKVEYFYKKGDKLSYDDIYYTLLDLLGEAPADWDVVDEEGNTDWSQREVRDHYLFLDRLRSPYNVGSVFRSAESFCVKGIYLAPGTADPEHPRSRRTSRDTIDGVSWEYRELEEVEDLPVFALELGGKDVTEFEFPKKGICIIGSEESGVSPEALEKADKSLGRVSIRQYGAKGSINVSAATAILLQKWMEADH